MVTERGVIMSIWTHVLGIIRYDSFAANMSPVAVNKDQILAAQMQQISDSYQRSIPSGSEGPLDIQVILTNRGPTVVITGDLRDFEEADLQEIITWLNSQPDSLGNSLETMTFIRDVNILCDVESNGEYAIKYDEGWSVTKT